MWPRYTEIVIGAWIVISAFVYPAAPAEIVNRVVCGSLIAVCAIASFRFRTRYAYLLNFFVASWLIVHAWFASSYPAAPVYQSDILIGLVELMFAIIPNDAFRPPRGWDTLIDLDAERDALAPTHATDMEETSK